MLQRSYSALQDSCPLERVNRQWLNSVMVHNTKAIGLYSDIDSCSFTTPARQLTCKALYPSVMSCAFHDVINGFTGIY